MPAQSQRNPFPGLRAFESDEEYLFFGREGQSEEILHRLREHRFLAIVGTSGSGKSSLVRAGLLPYLYGGFMPGRGSHWRAAIFRPGGDPIGNLARALNAPSMLGSPDAIGDEVARNAMLLEVTLRHSGLGLIEAVRLAGLPSRDNILIIIDQFEELFRFAGMGADARHEDDANAFVKLLLEAVGQTELPIYVAITMRSEFIGDCARFRDLPEAVTRSPYLIPWMTRKERRMAIEEPVRVAQGKISQRLVARILNDGGENPDQLPIMQHALMRTWDYWQAHHVQGEEIDLDHYIEVGGVANALSLHADLTFDQLPGAPIKLIAKRIFQSLTERLSESRDVRRPLTIAKLMDETDCTFDEAVAVVEQFRQPGCSFLMPPRETKLKPDTVIDISHESLIRGWRRLAEWVQEEHESAAFYRRLAEWAADHAKGRAALWQNPDLQTALDWNSANKPNAAWAQRYHPGFDQAMAFLDQSCKAAQAAKEAEELRKAEEEKRKTEELRRTRAHLKIVGALCIAALTMLVVVVFYVHKYHGEKQHAQALAKSMEESENRSLKIMTQTLVELYELPDATKRATGVRELNESFLGKASDVSQQILNQDKSNHEARLLATISASLLVQLHAGNTGNDDERRKELHAECEHNIQDADDLRHHQNYFDLVMSALLSASAATTLQTEGDHERARDTALRAVSDLQEAWATIPFNDDLLWGLSESGYSISAEVLQKESVPFFRALRNPSVLRLFANQEFGQQWLERVSHNRKGNGHDKHKANEGVDPDALQGENSRSSILSTLLNQVAEAEQALDLQGNVTVTFEVGEKLARKILANPESSEGALDSTFWFFANQGLSYIDAKKFEPAHASLDRAKSILARFKGESAKGALNNIAILSFSGTLHRSKSAAVEGRPEAESESKAALHDDKQSLELAQTYEGYNDPKEHAKLLILLQQNVAQDDVRLRDYRSAEQMLQETFRLIQRTYAVNSSDYDKQLNGAFIRTSHTFQDSGDYATSREWLDRAIKAFGGPQSWMLGAKQRQDRRTILSGIYGQRSWVDLFMGDFGHAISDAEQGLRLDPDQTWILTNKAHGLLFSGKLNQAAQLYQANMEKMVNDKETFAQAVQGDFKEFRQKPNPKMNLDYLSKMEASIEGLRAQNKNGAH